MSGKEAAIIMVQRSVGGVYVPSFQKGALMVPPLVGNFELIPANCMVGLASMFRQGVVFLFTKKSCYWCFSKTCTELTFGLSYISIFAVFARGGVNY